MMWLPNICSGSAQLTKYFLSFGVNHILRMVSNDRKASTHPTPPKVRNLSEKSPLPPPPLRRPFDRRKKRLCSPSASQFSPLSAFGCNLRSNFPATLFRFPLRTPEQASVSRLSRQAHGVEDMRALLRAFATESAGMLLFLKNVERMSVFEWGYGQSEPRQVT